ncbi:hypothetical protein OAM67_00910 [bacterium]|nr:hypothetical protein [bacterium]
MQTICRTLAAAGITGRFASASGGMTAITFPLYGRPSLALGQGAMARGALRWGIVTEEEYQVGMKPNWHIASCICSKSSD